MLAPSSTLQLMVLPCRTAGQDDGGLPLALAALGLDIVAESAWVLSNEQMTEEHRQMKVSEAFNTQVNPGL